MQQALEALETCGEDEWHSDDDFGMMQVYDEAKVTQAITALKQALAEPEQNPFGDDAERYARKLREWREFDKALFAEHKPQTTHREGCEAVHPECKEKNT
jgi:hypothetical protein